MPRPLTAAVAAALVALAAYGCGGRGDTTLPATSQPPGTTAGGGPVLCPDETGFDARTLVGLTEAQAREAAQRRGCQVRVVRRDGEALAVTEDYNPRRINVEVQGGRVSAAVSVN